MSEKNKDMLSDDDLWCLLIRTWFAISRLRQVELTQYGLTAEQSSILTTIGHTGDSATAKDLEILTMRQQHSISTLIKRMLRGGLVGKEKKPGEKRYRIFITEEGKSLLNKVTTVSIEMAFSSLTTKEKEQFLNYVCSLHTKVRDLIGVSYKPPFLQAVCGGAARATNPASDSNTMESDYELWKSLDSAGFAVSRLRELELAQFGLTLEQSLILIIIRHFGGSTTAKEIENLTLRQHHSISTLINRMVRGGLVMKEKSPAEKRYRVFMTEEGKSLLNKVTTVSIEMAFSSLTTNEKAQFAHCLKALHKEARNLLGIPHRQPQPQHVA